MPLQQNHFPMGNSPFPWGTVICASLLICSVGYLSYIALKPNVNNENIQS